MSEKEKVTISGQPPTELKELFNHGVGVINTLSGADKEPTDQEWKELSKFMRESLTKILKKVLPEGTSGLEISTGDQRPSLPQPASFLTEGSRWYSLAWLKISDPFYELELHDSSLSFCFNMSAKVHSNELNWGVSFTPSEKETFWAIHNLTEALLQSYHTGANFSLQPSRHRANFWKLA